MGTDRRRRHFPFDLGVLVLCCLGLAAWIVYLVVALPTTYRAHNWDTAWIGFDAAMLGSLLVTTWAAWRQRLLLVPAALVSATLLGVDSWFDVVTSQPGRDLMLALLSAALVELPLALFLVVVSRRTIHRVLDARAAGPEGRRSLTSMPIPETRTPGRR